MTEESKIQAYIIQKIAKFTSLLYNTPIKKHGVFTYWYVDENKWIKTGYVEGKFYCFLVSKDEEITYLSYCEEGNSEKFFNTLPIEKIDKLLKCKLNYQ